MTTFWTILTMLESGPCTKAQIVAALGSTRLAEKELARLRERQDIKTIGRGVYALAKEIA